MGVRDPNKSHHLLPARVHDTGKWSQEWILDRNPVTPRKDTSWLLCQMSALTYLPASSHYCSLVFWLNFHCQTKNHLNFVLFSFTRFIALHIMFMSEFCFKFCENVESVRMSTTTCRLSVVWILFVESTVLIFPSDSFTFTSNSSHMLSLFTNLRVYLYSPTECSLSFIILWLVSFVVPDSLSFPAGDILARYVICAL